MTGYSGTPLAKKLGIKPGSRIWVADAPAEYEKLISPVPEGVQFAARLAASTDIAHIFVTRRGGLAKALRNALQKLRPDAAIWVSWPKKASKVRTDITEDVIRETALPMGLVDIKVCAVDQTWSGLKLVTRNEKRK
jgi:hypothetical protein